MIRSNTTIVCDLCETEVPWPRYPIEVQGPYGWIEIEFYGTDAESPDLCPACSQKILVVLEGMGIKMPERYTGVREVPL